MTTLNPASQSTSSMAEQVAARQRVLNENTGSAIARNKQEVEQFPEKTQGTASRLTSFLQGRGAKIDMFV
jgi:hypothetical protein